jgi:YihY family inner membrane protein
MSTARLVPETWELSGDEARETLRRTGRRKLVRDAFVLFRASDGFSHARSLAFVTSLLLVQGVILLVGLAASLGDTDLSASIVRAITEAVPGPAGKALTDAVFHAYKTGASGQNLVLVIIGVTTIITGTTLMGQMERALNRLYGIEQDRPTLQKYGRALALALTAGVLSTAAFAMFALGHGIGQSLNDDTVTQIWNVVRWPIALLLMMAAIALLFRWSPARHQPAWSWLAFGSTVSVLLWSLVTLGLGFFFQASTTFSTTYGPLAGMIAILLWSLLSSIAILFGAAVAVQLEAVRAGASAPRDESKAEVGSAQGSPALAGTR